MNQKAPNDVANQDPAIKKYLTREGIYSKWKSEVVREAYKDDRRRLGNTFNPNASRLWDKLFQH